MHLLILLVPSIPQQSWFWAKPCQVWSHAEAKVPSTGVACPTMVTQHGRNAKRYMFGIRDGECSLLIQKISFYNCIGFRSNKNHSTAFLMSVVRIHLTSTKAKRKRLVREELTTCQYRDSGNNRHMKWQTKILNTFDTPWRNTAGRWRKSIRVLENELQMSRM